MTEPEKLTAPRRPKKTKSPAVQKTEYWGARVMIVLGTTLITSYFSYRLAKSDAENKAEKISSKLEVKAEAGYGELAGVLESLDKDRRAVLVYLGKLESRIEFLEKRKISGNKYGIDTSLPETHEPQTPVAILFEAHEVVQMKRPPKPEPLELAPTLSSAAAKAKKGPKSPSE